MAVALEYGEGKGGEPNPRILRSLKESTSTNPVLKWSNVEKINLLNSKRRKIEHV